VDNHAFFTGLAIDQEMQGKKPNHNPASTPEVYLPNKRVGLNLAEISGEDHSFRPQ
jgi:hypothetical protein